MKVRIGTSGYNYSWNRCKDKFRWYIDKGFKTVEINASFYSFPSKTWINTWLDAPEWFEFSIKVHRSITHYSRLSSKALSIMDRFMDRLKPIEDKIKFYLFQMPPSFRYSKDNLARVNNFFDRLALRKSVIEFRDASWWEHKEEVNAIFCSIDAPNLPRDIINNHTIYLRLHGRDVWYDYLYSIDELREIYDKIMHSNAKECYIYLNNDHAMLDNADMLNGLFRIINNE